MVSQVEDWRECFAAALGGASRPHLRPRGHRPARARSHLGEVRTTSYFRERVLPKRPYLREKWSLKTILDPEDTAIQGDGHLWHWRYIPELGRVLRVVTLPDGVTVHNAFPDRGFRSRPR